RCVAKIDSLRKIFLTTVAQDLAAESPAFPNTSEAVCCTSGGNSEISITWRISIVSLSEAGHREAHSTASSFDRTWIIQYPPTTSLVSVNGPSTTFGLPPENVIRDPI